MNMDYSILYVADVGDSVAFYEKILGVKPVSASPGFAVFAMPSGNKLGLWLASDVKPPAPATVGGSEIGISVDTDEKVDMTASIWEKDGTTITQKPVTVPFGRTFTALDPDGHRVRVYCLAADRQ
ncbi:VOC family protein [Rhizobium sp. L1K21]|uniref:VOC family protein n=1 Tax=Rhizobium sp. L1K21 TaxID=2954933 RepID=UPI002093AEBE|nr:VOC family protein [Rhizobium sp. L1K21]MCO6184957.1 VOC family protein [Rhizobium sp. L1K21]